MESSINDQAAKLLLKFGRVFANFEKMQVKSFNLTVPQSYTLLTVSDLNKITMNELAGQLRVTQTTMTRVVDNLVRDGYLERLRNEADRRIVEVQLTDKGRENVDRLKKLYSEVAVSIVEKMPAEHHAKVIESLRILLRTMEQDY